MPSFAVIVPAAGKSSRFAGRDKKPFVPLDGRALWLRAFEHFVARPDVQQCIIVIAAEDEEKFRERYGPNLMFMGIDVVLGGAERFESVANALAKVRPEIEFVAVHDAVRPNLTSTLIDRVFQEAHLTGAAIPAIPVADTVKQVNEAHEIISTVPREALWLAQTPQVFRRDWLEEAYRRRGELSGTITDDAQLVEAIGKPVRVVQGLPSNFKITTQADLQLAELMLRQQHNASADLHSSAQHPFADEEY